MGFSPWPGHQALEMLWGGCRLLLPEGLRSPETHVQRPPGAQWSPRGREPRADAQGIRKETDSSPAPECGFPHHSPLQGRLSLPHHGPARLPGNKPPGPSCLLGAPGSLGTVSSSLAITCKLLGVLIGVRALTLMRADVPINVCPLLMEP